MQRNPPPQTPQLPAALPVHGGSPPHDPAVARGRPTQRYTHLTEEDMPGIWRAFLETLHCLKLTD